MLEHDADRPADRVQVQGVDLERDQGPGPVDRLGDRGRLLELELAQLDDHGDDLGREARFEVRQVGEQDLTLPVGIGVVDVQVETAPLHGLGQLTGGVGGQHDERTAYGGDRAELGDRDLEVAEHLQQQPFDLHIGLVHLVDQQDGRLLAPDGGEQRPGQQELVGEDVVVRLAPRVVRPGCLDAE